MFDLFMTMFERLGIIVMIAFILTRFRFFREMIHRDALDSRQLLKAAVFFGFFGIIGTYTGLTFHTDSLNFDRWGVELSNDEAIANSRVIGVVLAGLFGGFRVGLGAGLIAGIHRYTLGGFTALSCGLATIVAGVIASAFYRKNKHVKLSSAFLIGALAETIQMLIILLLSKPFDKALTLVENIGVPMVFANGVGCALFLFIIRNVVNEEEKAAAIQAQKSLRIARKTLSYLRKGMSSESAAAVCQILKEEVKASAIAITDEIKILAHVGVGNDHHFPNLSIQTDVTKKVIREGNLVIAGRKEIQCSHLNCPLGAVLIGPLKQGDKTIGTLKFYFPSEKEITNVTVELMKGLSMLLSYQIEVSQVEKVSQLAKEAEIKALQAQISPHFLFNSLNIIVSLIRLDPAKARKLLISLSHFFRQNLSATTQEWTTLSEELKHVRAYLAIEETRFIDKLSVNYDIDEDVLLAGIPPLTLQPLVENAIKHGIKEKDQNCKIEIKIKNWDKAIKVEIIDNGAGIENSKIERLGKSILTSEESTGTGIGLYNVNRRLMMLFGNKSALQIESSEGEGTSVGFLIPYFDKEK